MQERGLEGTELVVSDAHKGLQKAIRECFSGSSWQRCKVHFMRNILVHVPHKQKKTFASKLKLIWQAGTAEDARLMALQLAETYRKRFPKAIAILEAGLEDSLSYFAFPDLDSRKISSNIFSVAQILLTDYQ
ncbi:MAG TPA: transposase [Oscillospiraceae bacterium]|nr:transposase [Oscillospiraceae bacterium]